MTHILFPLGRVLAQLVLQHHFVTDDSQARKLLVLRKVVRHLSASNSGLELKRLGSFPSNIRMYHLSGMIKRAGSSHEIVDSLAKQLQANWVDYMGPWFLALITLTFMMSVLTIQATNYFSTFGFESIWLFSLVVSCILLSIAQWLTVAISLWDWCVKYYGDYRRFLETHWTQVSLPLILWLTVFTSQLFFASRCYTLYGRSKLVFGALLLGMTACLGRAVYLVTMMAIDPFNIPLFQKTSYVALAIGVATDVAITGLTLWKLVRGKKGYSPQAQHALQRLRNMTAETAMPPTIAMILDVVFYVTMGKRNRLSTLFAIATSALYVWSMMFTLNSRVAIRQAFNAPGSEEQALSTNFRFVNFEAANATRGQGDIEKGTDLNTAIPEQPPAPRRSTSIPLGCVGGQVDPGITQSRVQLSAKMS